MSLDNDILFSPITLKNITLPNRFIRSATYEGLADVDGILSNEMTDIYCRLARNKVGTIIAGFCFISQQGRAMQPRQVSVSDDKNIKSWNALIRKVKSIAPETKLFMQLAHTGRQTLTEVTGCLVVGASTKKCTYFKQKVSELTNSQIETIITQFADSARRAQKAGFDGVQIHAAHGYLVHQFLSSDMNLRKDKWSEPNMFLLEILKAVKQECGYDYPVLIKLSHSDDKLLTIEHSIKTVNLVEEYADAVEISYGTMEVALNIFRGTCPIETILKVNPMFNKIPPVAQWLWKKLSLKKYMSKFIPFTENYNLDAAIKINQNSNLPVITVGGIRNLDSMVNIIENEKIAAIALCRPFICQPDLVNKIAQGHWGKSKCINCNLCAIYCDSNNSLRCYYGKESSI